MLKMLLTNKKHDRKPIIAGAINRDFTRFDWRIQTISEGQ